MHEFHYRGSSQTFSRFSIFIPQNMRSLRSEKSTENGISLRDFSISAVAYEKVQVSRLKWTFHVVIFSRELDRKSHVELLGC